MTATNDLDTPTSERERSAYANLAAEFALAGMALIKSDPAACDLAPYYAMRWGAVKPLADLEEARQFLKHRRGAGHGQAVQG